MEQRAARLKRTPADLLYSLYDFGESSDDSDFNIENCSDKDQSDIDFDDESNESDNEKDHGDDFSEDESEKSKKEEKEKDEKCAGQKIIVSPLSEESVKGNLVCSVCLGETNSGINEIVECDGCGVTVHEGCYGIQDNISLASTGSSFDTEPWFCEACRAGKTNPECELCPNTGGIFKETNVGKWVHLICSLYTPNIRFGEIEALTNVILFNIPPSAWGSKPCVLCDDKHLASTGVTVSCDVGLCRTSFHVTCAQREGLLSDATPIDDPGDPFYAICRLHSDSEYRKKKKRNFAAMEVRLEIMNGKRKRELEENAAVWQRNQRKLVQYKEHYSKLKQNRPPPIIPTTKVPRLLTTNPSAVRALLRKTEAMGLANSSNNASAGRLASFKDRKKSTPPSLSIDFIGYFMQRDKKMTQLQKEMSEDNEKKQKLIEEQDKLQEMYSKLETEQKEVMEKQDKLRKSMQLFCRLMKVCHPERPVPSESEIEMEYKPFSSSRKDEPSTSTAGEVINICAKCSKSTDLHMMTKCDTCLLFYHLGCLDPPLARMPKKTKKMGWQCSECDGRVTEPFYSDVEEPRKLRHGDRGFSYADQDNFVDDVVMDLIAAEDDDLEINQQRRKGKKRRKEKHTDRYSPDLLPLKNRGKKRKKKLSCQVIKIDDAPRQGIKLFIKSIPNPQGDSLSEGTTSTFVAKTEEYITDAATPTSAAHQKTTKVVENKCDRCDACNNIGTNLNMVKCDECSKCFHFGCLDPPVKKSPKVRGYSWHCADCDPTDIFV